MTTNSTMSLPPPGSVLTGKQEHYLKRELLSQQVKREINDLASPTALQRFGAPFRSDKGEVKPEDSDLPILRYVFVNHVRNFPFLDQAREKEFWQDKLQVFLESFANKNISSSEDRLEMTKRKKLANKAEKLMELMMVSGLPTASGYEERIRFSEIEVVDRGADENGLVANRPEGRMINGWDINVAGVRKKNVKRHVRTHVHAEYLLRVKQAGKDDIYVGRRYSDFQQLNKRLRLEMPGKVLPPVPRKNRRDSAFHSTDADDSDSVSSLSTMDTTTELAPAPFDPANTDSLEPAAAASYGSSLRSYLPFGGGHRRNASATSLKSPGTASPRPSGDVPRTPLTSTMLYREEQRISLRAFLRTLLQNPNIASSNSMHEFLTHDPITLTDDEVGDCERRKEMDEKRIIEQRQFYEIARQRAAELDEHMEKFRREIVESNGLRKLFQEVREKNTIQELRPEYQKFAEWLRIEVAATLYHLFLAEDNSPDLFAQARRIHSMIPYTVLKNVIRLANPAAVMSGVLDLFLAQPFGTKSLLQRVFGMAIHDGIRQMQRQIEAVEVKIDDQVLSEKIKNYTQADGTVKEVIRVEAEDDQVDIVVALLRCELIQPDLDEEQVAKVFNAYVAWNNAVENIDEEMKQGAVLFAHLKQLLKLHMRQRDKEMMLQLIEEPNTLKLFRSLFTIFYEPLVRVYKSANVYNSITDFAVFVDDAIKVISAAQHQSLSADPNQTVQAFIDLCARHEHNFYKFVHEVHIHDNGLFDQLMSWVEGILDFLRNGPRSGEKLDMNKLFTDSYTAGQIDGRKSMREINSLIKWQAARKRWHQDKTRQKMAADGGIGPEAHDDIPGLGKAGFTASDFGMNSLDLEEMEYSDEDGLDDDDEGSETDEEEEIDPIKAERNRRKRHAERLKRSAGEPKKPEVKEIYGMEDEFVGMLRRVLAG
ncbi:hypothetical protein NA57DRAFT_38568 [Rhizodiscina lignyota]|uniref:PX domain-containing protein n=1 Tax=Rhizodiscina lignyota TaxID=1504668 RepID=A0A9P4IH01_9PEZI|nr:hypothetical protein NA57DRAFT_38568 [Rhizodiscina lignyota]